MYGLDCLYIQTKLISIDINLQWKIGRQQERNKNRLTHLVIT